MHIAIDDGSTVLAPDFTTGHDPELLLDTDALLPREPTTRIALYGCDVGGFESSAITARVRAAGKQVIWVDVRLVGEGFYRGAFPFGALPDPLVVKPQQATGTPRFLEFDHAAYSEKVVEARDIRFWETRPRAVARMIRVELGWNPGREGSVMAWMDLPDAVAVNVNRGGSWKLFLLPLLSEDNRIAAREMAQFLRGRSPDSWPGAEEIHG